MAKSEVELITAHLDTMNEVVSLYLRGENESHISKSLKMSRQRVVGFLQEWRGMVADNSAIRSRAHEALASTDVHYSALIAKAYEVMDGADQLNGTAALNSKSGAIKLIADMEAKRIELLQKAGMLDNNDLAEQVAASEEKQEILEGILKDVVSKCNNCKTEVMSRLSSATDDAVTVDYTIPEPKKF